MAEGDGAFEFYEAIGPVRQAIRAPGVRFQSPPPCLSGCPVLLVRWFSMQPVEGIFGVRRPKSNLPRSLPMSNVVLGSKDAPVFLDNIG